MEEENFQNITIEHYLKMLKSGKETVTCKNINDWLNSKISGATGGFDLHLFQLQKDLLLIQCKHLIATMEFDEKKQIRYSKRIDELIKQIKKKTDQKGKKETTPYRSFLEWLFTLKKYYGSEIDRSNTLIELIVATEQMMKFYENQNQNYENQITK